MKAVRIHEYGSVDVLKMEEVPMPEIADDELLIKIYATSVNPVDWKIREGKLTWRNLHHLPLILGWDVSGVVEKTGRNVQHFKVGDEVYTRPAIDRDGSYAEYIAVREDIVAFKPSTVTHLEAASVPLVGLTAWEALVTTANIQPEQRVLIHAASGGVGSIAVQLAKIYGCYVIGTTSAENFEMVKNLGADEVIDYKTQEFTQLTGDLDIVLDTVGGQTQRDSMKVIKENGILVSTINPPDETEAKEHRIRCGYFFVNSNGKVLTTLAHLVNTHKLKPVVGPVFQFTEEDLKKAEELSQSGKTAGKIVIAIR